MSTFGLAAAGSLFFQGRWERRCSPLEGALARCSLLFLYPRFLYPLRRSGPRDIGPDASRNPPPRIGRRLATTIPAPATKQQSFRHACCRRAATCRAAPGPGLRPVSARRAQHHHRSVVIADKASNRTEDRATRRLPQLARCLGIGVAALACGCEGVQSTFSTFGAEAESSRALTIVMSAAAAIITIAVLALAFHAVRAPEGSLDHRQGMRVILWLGALGPTILLTILLVSTLPGMRPLAAAPGDLEVHVEGRQFWWRVRYQPGDGEPVEAANEIRLPVGRTVTFSLDSPDVIHSFWIPGLAGKTDLIPGRTNKLVVQATQAGSFRGVCTEFCGLSHALMAFDVIAMEAADFDRWLVAQSQPAAVEDDTAGRRLFDEYGCAGCHAVRGATPGSPIGPDLTHFGSRKSVAAGTLPMAMPSVASFIRNPPASKPGALMPSFPDMSDEDAQAIAAWLMELR